MSMPASMRRNRRIAGQYEVTEATGGRSDQSSDLRNLNERGGNDRQEAKLANEDHAGATANSAQRPSNRRGTYNEARALSPVRFEHSGLCHRFFTWDTASV